MRSPETTPILPFPRKRGKEDSEAVRRKQFPTPSWGRVRVGEPDYGLPRHGGELGWGNRITAHAVREGAVG